VVPASGIGARFDSSLPKQYSPLFGSTVIEHCLERLLSIPCEEIIVPLNNQDNTWQTLDIFNNERIRPIEGGSQRAISVLNALTAIEEKATDQDWVLVHDVVRPCITQADLRTLINNLSNSMTGGLLASPINATVKRVIESEDGLLEVAEAGDNDHESIAGIVGETVDREGLWLAATPQMFRYGPLIAAIKHGLGRGIEITDEAAAMELSGHQPTIIRGRPDNIKITHAEDLALAEAIFQAQNVLGERLLGEK
jgi:2-C-methyl-D-erythritol 4-phosphate cytidylyltransferase